MFSGLFSRLHLLLLFIATTGNAFAQEMTYKDSIELYQSEYVKNHEVVTGNEKKKMTFFPADEKYRVLCRFEKKENEPWFRMESTGPIKRNYRVYGKIYFSINDTALELNIYQSQELMLTEKYRDHLFIPFTDATSGSGTYTGGRYLDINIPDIVNNHLLLDFNKAYNPYCAYVSGIYNCPIPPPENSLPVAIQAGEKTFANPH